MLRAPWLFASRSAASVSAVSPDCVMMTVSVLSSTIGLAIAILRAVVDFGRDAGQLLDQELPDQPGMPGRAARQQLHLVDRPEIVVGQRHLVEEHEAGVLRDTPEDGFAHGRRLLEDLLEHEVLVAGLFGLDGIPGDALRLLLDDSAGQVGELARRRASRSPFPGRRETRRRGCAGGSRECRRRRTIRPRRDRRRPEGRCGRRRSFPDRRPRAARWRTGRAAAASRACTAPSRPSSFHSCSTRCATTSVSVSVTNLWPLLCSSCLSSR